jgi:hypothetical protein
MEIEKYGERLRF